MDNLRGALLLVVAMAFFNGEDVFIKLLSDRMPTGQIMLAIGLGGFAIFLAVLARLGLPFWTPALRHPKVLLRTAGEMVGALGFVTALALIDISMATAILMAAPLATVMGAAIFLGEPVGWRRWTAVLLGFCGVMLIVKPGMVGFEPASLWAVLGVAGLVTRDIATRQIPPDVPSPQISAAAYLGATLAGVIMLVIFGDAPVMPHGREWLSLILAIGLGACGYAAIVSAMRIGEVSVIIPFRYTRLVFALIIGVLLFHERPDGLTLLGCAIIVGSGLYTVLREAQIKRRAAAASKAGFRTL